MSAEKILANPIALAGLGILAVYLMRDHLPAAAKEIGAAAVDTADAAAEGVVVSIGKRLGIPETNRTQCQIDIDNGDVWAASFSCPLGDFLAFKKSTEQ